jgi:microcystin-dependent protein
MFNGLIEDIPEGWAICNGENGTPDLRGRFIRSVVSDGGSGLDLNDRGVHDNPDLTKPDNGRKTSIVINSDNLPAHLHKYKGTSKASGDTEDTAI